MAEPENAPPLSPTQWPAWIAIAFGWTVAHWPWPLARAVAPWLGRLMQACMWERGRVAQTNLGLCFPELDDAGRARLREIHEKSVHELESVLSPELQKELGEVVLPFSSDAPSESELRLAQAQLVGWLEGLFHGIQATLFTQQAMAQGQLDEVRRRRALQAVPGESAAPGEPEPPSGYL